jgi:DNA gyrase/topoisomerase IV subunit A
MIFQQLMLVLGLFLMIILLLKYQILTEKGYIKRLRPDTFSAQNRGTAGKAAGKLKADDALSKFFVCKTHDYLLFFR